MLLPYIYSYFFILCVGNADSDGVTADNHHEVWNHEQKGQPDWMTCMISAIENLMCSFTEIIQHCRDVNVPLSILR